MSSSTNSTFSAPDQLSDPSTGFLATHVARNASGASAAVWTSSDTELLWASPVVLSGPAALFGTNLADRAGGTASADIARMGAGNDRFTGKGGNDRISGEAGNDFVDGGSGANVLNGGPGRDTCVKRSRRDRLSSCEVVRRP
jgi:Ca2+-binding RTX toxin-like protein